MPTIHEIICIQCPLACRVRITTNPAGKIMEVTDYQCKEGKKYAPQEFKSPKRILTATVKTENSIHQLLPVRTNKPVPKEMLKDCMAYLSRVKVKPVLKIGEIIVPNILSTGVNVVCSDDLWK